MHKKLNFEKHKTLVKTSHDSNSEGPSKETISVSMVELVNITLIFRKKQKIQPNKSILA